MEYAADSEIRDGFYCLSLPNTSNFSSLKNKKNPSLVSTDKKEKNMNSKFFKKNAYNEDISNDRIEEYIKLAQSLDLYVFHKSEKITFAIKKFRKVIVSSKNYRNNVRNFIYLKNRICNMALIKNLKCKDFFRFLDFLVPTYNLSKVSKSKQTNLYSNTNICFDSLNQIKRHYSRNILHNTIKNTPDAYYTFFEKIFHLNFYNILLSNYNKNLHVFGLNIIELSKLEEFKNFQYSKITVKNQENSQVNEKQQDITKKHPTETLFCKYNYPKPKIEAIKTSTTHTKEYKSLTNKKPYSSSPYSHSFNILTRNRDGFDSINCVQGEKRHLFTKNSVRFNKIDCIQEDKILLFVKTKQHARLSNYVPQNCSNILDESPPDRLVDFNLKKHFILPNSTRSVNLSENHNMRKNFVSRDSHKNIPGMTKGGFSLSKTLSRGFNESNLMKYNHLKSQTPLQMEKRDESSKIRELEKNSCRIREISTKMGGFVNFPFASQEVFSNSRLFDKNSTPHKKNHKSRVNDKILHKFYSKNDLNSVNKERPSEFLLVDESGVTKNLFMSKKYKYSNNKFSKDNSKMMNFRKFNRLNSNLNINPYFILNDNSEGFQKSMNILENYRQKSNCKIDNIQKIDKNTHSGISICKDYENKDIHESFIMIDRLYQNSEWSLSNHENIKEKLLKRKESKSNILMCNDSWHLSSDVCIKMDCFGCEEDKSERGLSYPVKLFITDDINCLDCNISEDLILDSEIIVQDLKNKIEQSNIRIPLKSTDSSLATTACDFENDFFKKNYKLKNSLVLENSKKPDLPHLLSNQNFLEFESLQSKYNEKTYFFNTENVMQENQQNPKIIQKDKKVKEPESFALKKIFSDEKSNVANKIENNESKLTSNRSIMKKNYSRTVGVNFKTRETKSNSIDSDKKMSFRLKNSKNNFVFSKEQADIELSSSRIFTQTAHEKNKKNLKPKNFVSDYSLMNSTEFLEKIQIQELETKKNKISFEQIDQDETTISRPILNDHDYLNASNIENIPVNIEENKYQVMNDFSSFINFDLDSHDRIKISESIQQDDYKGVASEDDVMLYQNSICTKYDQSLFINSTLNTNKCFALLDDFSTFFSSSINENSKLFNKKKENKHWSKIKERQNKCHSVPVRRLSTVKKLNLCIEKNGAGIRTTLTSTESGKSDCFARITNKTLVSLIKNVSHSDFCIIDCRFDYEYQGGHILNAYNINEISDLEAFYREKQNFKIIVFHCEFSSIRAPRMAKMLRNLDRNTNKYPKLIYPEVYILEGGYKSFFKEFPTLCRPMAYTKMDTRIK